MWIRALEARHLADLTFSEVARALRALSSAYVERRHKLAEGAALSGAGKRAAFALFYGPLHYLIGREITRASPAMRPASRTIVDLGCGTGAAGAAWASSDRAGTSILGVDQHPWAVAEAAWTYRHFEISGRTRRGDATSIPIPDSASIIAAFTINEIADDAVRTALLERLLRRRSHRGAVLIVEPLAGRIAPWWARWREEFRAHGGRADEWRFRVELPDIVAKLDRAAGLNHRELTARSLALIPSAARSTP